MDISPETVNRRSNNLSIFLAERTTELTKGLTEEEIVIIVPAALLKFLAMFYSCKGKHLSLEDQEQIVGSMSRILRKELVLATETRKQCEGREGREGTEGSL